MRPPGLQDPMDLFKARQFVRGQVDDAIADDDIHGGRIHREMLDIALAELHVAEAVLLGQLPSAGHHVLGHVHADDPAVLPHLFGRQEDVDAGAGAQVQDGFAIFEVRQGGGVAAAHSQNRPFPGPSARSSAV